MSHHYTVLKVATLNVNKQRRGYTDKPLVNLHTSDAEPGLYFLPNDYVDILNPPHGCKKSSFYAASVC